MKIFILLILLCTSFCFSQGQVFFGVNGGVNVGNLSSYSEEEGSSLSAGMGYIVSGDVNIPISNSAYLQTGLQYENYHGKASSDLSFQDNGLSYQETISAKLNAAFLNIPAKICFRLQSNKHTFIAGAGPFLGIGLNGKIKAKTFEEISQNGSIISSNSSEINQPISFGNGQDQVKKLNAGIGLQLSYLLKSNLNFTIYSNLGFTNLSNDDASKAKTRSAGFTIGYIFNK